jgi:ATP-dependent helicase IRC3
MDFVDVCSQLSVVSLPSLFGLDPAELDEEGTVSICAIHAIFLIFSASENVETLEAKSQTKAALSMDDYNDELTMARLSDPNVTVNYIDHEDPFSLMDNMSGAPNIFRLSYNAWVGCGDDIYVLPCLQYGDVRIQPTQNRDGTCKPHDSLL